MNKFLNIIATMFLATFLIAGSATLSLTNFNEDSGSVDVYMVNDTPVGGVQFDLTGLSGMSVSGGTAASAGFTVSTGGSTILGFSFTGATFPLVKAFYFQFQVILQAIIYAYLWVMEQSQILMV